MSVFATVFMILKSISMISMISSCIIVAPEPLKARIRVLEKELHPSSLLAGNLRSLPPNKYI